MLIPLFSALRVAALSLAASSTSIPTGRVSTGRRDGALGTAPLAARAVFRRSGSFFTGAL
eukprot:2000030-Rhodomonas_salina.1